MITVGAWCHTNTFCLEVHLIYLYYNRAVYLTSTYIVTQKDDLDGHGDFFQGQIINKSRQALGPTCDALVFRLFNDIVLLTSTLFMP